MSRLRMKIRGRMKRTQNNHKIRITNDRNEILWEKEIKRREKSPENKKHITKKNRNNNIGLHIFGLLLTFW